MQPNLLPDRRRDILLLIFSILGIVILTGAGRLSGYNRDRLNQA